MDLFTPVAKQSPLMLLCTKAEAIPMTKVEEERSNLPSHCYHHLDEPFMYH